MRKILCAAIVVGSFLFVGSGAALANLITLTADDWVNQPPANLIFISDNGFYPYSHDIRDDGYTSDPTDLLVGALLTITMQDYNGSRTDKFSINIELTEFLDYNNHLEVLTNQQGIFTFDDVGYPSLTASILANPNGFFNVKIFGGGNNFPLYFVSSLLHAEWTRDDGGGGVIIESPPIGAAVVPEPATMLLLGTGLVGVAGAVRRKKKLV